MKAKAILGPTILALAPLFGLSAQDAPKGDAKTDEPAPFVIDYGKRPAPKDCKVAKWGPDSYESPNYAVRCRKILPVTGEPIENGTILVQKGKILAIGKSDEIEVPDGFEVVDCGDGWIVPGFIDLHCHIAGDGFDLNDMVHPTNPEFRTLDLVGLHHDQIKEALQGGVTSVLYIPGSGTNMGGFGTLTKTAGRNVEEALIRFPGSLKIAQAGNPERGAGDMGAGRIGMNFGLRQTLLRGKAYSDAWLAYEAGKGEKPKFDPALHYLRGLFLHEYPCSVHTQIYQVCLETLRQLHDELGLWVFVDHGTFDAYRMSGEARKRGVPVCNGPRQVWVDRETGAMIGNAAAWALGGQHGWLQPVPGVGRDGIGINTDSPVIPQEELSVQAAMAVRLGLPWEWALRGLTINPARFVGADHKIGSLEVGKDADFVLWTGDPIDPRHSVRKVWVSGSIHYDRDPGGKNEADRRI
ncbi:MAG: amidohydrolase family protein [Planctomycetes bacterium]|nr:amidohydrolase family protein [Planctomycetota bacterium]